MTQTDRRFGTWNKFGTSNQFGASTLEADLAWGVEVDWDGDGEFDGTNEARHTCGLRVTRGRTAMLKSTGQGFETMRTGQAVITVWNDDGRFDGWNSSSPLYPHVSPGKDLRLRTRNLQASGEVIQSVFYGVISDVVPIYGGDRPKANIYVDDGWNFLWNYSARVALQENITIHEAIEMVLESVGWESRWGTNLATSSDSVPYWWGSGDRSAARECLDLADSAFGNFFVAADGSARFLTRTTLGASVVNFQQSELRKDIRNPQPWVNRRNVTQLKVHMRDVTGTALLYEQFGEPVRISTGETHVDFVSLTFNGMPVPALSIVAPVPNVDYTINSNEDGSGSDLVGSCVVTTTRLGDRAMRSIKNNSAGNAYVMTFQIRGVAIYERNVTDVYYPSDPATVRDPRKFFMDLPWQQNVNKAVDFCNRFGPFLDTSHPFPVVEVESQFDRQFGIDLFDICTLTTDKLGIGGVSFRIGGIEHETLDETMQRVKTTFYLEPYVADGDHGTFPLTWGTSTFGW